MPTNQQRKLPVNILDIIEKPLFDSFLRGYNNYTLSGVALYYFKNSIISDFYIENIGFIDPSDGLLNGKKNYHFFCKEYRETCGGQSKECIAFDQKLVQKFYVEKLKEPILYRCHMQMWDMAYPLWINDSLWGVLFAGQIISESPALKNNWVTELKKISKYVDFSSIKLVGATFNQKNEIIGAINNSNISKVFKKSLIDKVLTYNRESSISTEELIDRFNDFKTFGKLAEELFNKLYQSQKDAYDMQAQNIHSVFENECIEELSESGATSLITWQSALHKVLSKIQTNFKFIERLGVFHHEIEKLANESDKIVFNLVAMNSSRWWDTKPCYILKEQLIIITKNLEPKPLPHFLSAGVGESLAEIKKFMVYPYFKENTGIYTIIIIQFRENDSIIEERQKEYLAALLDRILRLDEVFRLNLREREMHADFEKNVHLTRHDLRTNGQIILGNIDKYDLLLKKGFALNDTEIATQRTLIYNSFKKLEDRIEKLTAEPKKNKTYKLESLDVYKVISNNIDLFRATAQKRGIKMHSVTPGHNIDPFDAFVLCERSELDRAVAALIDNAIKYSFDDTDIMVIFSKTEERFTFEIEDYGIGIPGPLLEKIKELGVRVEVNDYRRNRVGTGLGIYIANYVFCELLNGEIEFTSNPDPSPRNKSKIEFHNYITKVKVTIPITNDK
jgi:signal transduction histidine kinase/ligand-binding sensor protein